MTSQISPTALGLELVHALKMAISNESGAGNAVLTHRLPVCTPNGPVPVTYTVDLTRDPDGVFLVTCRDLPEVVTAGEDESVALSLAHLAILAALGRRREDRTA